MPIGVIADFEGATLDSYYRTNEQLDFKRARPGSISHWVAETDNGIRVCDSWESREDFQGTWFAGPQVVQTWRDTFPDGAFPSEPEVDVYNLHELQRETPVRQNPAGAKRADIGVVIDFEHATLDQYDRANENRIMTKAVPGRITQWVAQTDTGIRICGCWETRDAYARMVEEQFLPVAREVFPSEPTIVFYNAHHTHGVQDIPVIS